MTREEFRLQPLLMSETAVLAATGYARNTLGKMVECGVLEKVLPKGAGHAKYRKVQVAALVKMETELNERDFRRESFLMSEKRVTYWLGYAGHTLAALDRSGALKRLRPPGSGASRYRKVEVAALAGVKEWV